MLTITGLVNKTLGTVKEKYQQVMPETREKREQVYAVGFVALTYTACATTIWLRFREK